MDNIQGNVSTIAVAIYALLAPYIAQYISEDVFFSNNRISIGSLVRL